MKKKSAIMIISLLLTCSFALSSCFPWTVQRSLTNEYIGKVAELVPSGERSDAPAENEQAEQTVDAGRNSDQALEHIVEQMSLLKHPITFSVKGTDPEEIDAIMLRAAFLLDLSDIGFTSTYWEEPEALSVTLTPEYTDAFAARMCHQNPYLKSILSDSAIELYEKAVSVVEELALDTSNDVEKALLIRNYLIDQVTYAPEDYQEQEQDDIHEARGALINRIAVCDGYSDSYQLLLAIAGIRSIPITGTADEGPHAWNLVLLQDEWYHVDVTWDDPVWESAEDEQQDEQQASYYYGYFLINDDWIKEDHVWEESLYPKATSLSLNPYSLSGRVVGSYEEFKHLMLDSIIKGEKKIEMYILSYRESEYTLNFLDLLPMGYTYEVPDEGRNGVFRLTVN